MDLFNNRTFPLGFGTARLRSLNGGLSSRSARYLLQTAFDLGIRFFDTAPSYGQGQSETAIGLLPRRVTDAMLICSKVGYSYGRKALIINAIKPLLRPAASSASFLRQLAHKSRARMVHQGALSLDIQPDVIRASLAGTLRRLRRDRLDLLLLHDPGVASLNEDNCRVLESLKSGGLIGHWGVSTSDEAVAHRALHLDNLSALQVPVNPTWVSDAGDVFTRAKQRGIAVIANRVLASLPTPAEAPTAHDERQQLAQQCFSFALRTPAVRIVLSGTTHRTHLLMNVKCVNNLLPSLLP